MKYKGWTRGSQATDKEWEEAKKEIDKNVPISKTNNKPKIHTEQKKQLQRTTNKR